MGGCQTAGPRGKTGPAGGEAGQEVVASVNGVAISAEELEAAAKGQLQKIQAQIYQVKKRILDGLIEGKLLEKAAKEKGVSVEAYVAENVDAKVSPPTDEEIQAFYDSQKGRIQAPLEQMKGKISEHLMQTQKAAKEAGDDRPLEEERRCEDHARASPHRGLPGRSGVHKR